MLTVIKEAYDANTAIFFWYSKKKDKLTVEKFVSNSSDISRRKFDMEDDILSKIVEAGEPEAEVRNFVEQAGLDFVILLDPENKSLITFQHNSLPNSFVIDRKGNLRLAWLGAINGPTLEKYVTPLLKE